MLGPYMGVSHYTLPIHDENARPLAEGKPTAGNPISVKDPVGLIGQKGKREWMATVKVRRVDWTVRRDGKHLCAEGLKLGILLAQLRQLPTAERSEKAAQEDQYNRACSPIVRQANNGPIHGRQSKLGRYVSYLKGAHVFPPHALLKRTPLAIRMLPNYSREERRWAYTL